MKVFARREHVAKRASARGKCEPQTHFPFGFSLSRRLGQPRRGVPNPPFPDSNALAIEVKSSWVLAAGLPNLSSYIIITATIPIYNQATPNLWTPTGQQTAQLALVGIHVIGSAAGHPEMVWATREEQC